MTRNSNIGLIKNITHNLVVAALFIVCLPVSANDLSACATKDFSEINTPSKLPPQVQQWLGVDKKGLDGIAERDKPFNDTDTGDENLPMRRFSMAAISPACLFVVYEQGGIGYNVNLRIFLKDSSEWHAGEKFPDSRMAPQTYGYKPPTSFSEFVADSQFRIGEMYATGYGVPKDATEAVKWYRLATENASIDVKFWLGRMYAHGYHAAGIEKNLSEAVRIFELAAKQNPEGQFRLGMEYLHGKLLEQDNEKGAEWLRLAANQGLPKAQLELGILYKAGKGVQQDVDEAVKLFRLASSAPHPKNVGGIYELGLMYSRGIGVKQNYVVAHTLINYSVNCWFGSVPLPDPEWAKTDAWKELEVLQGLMNEKDINEAKGLCAEMRSSRNSPPSIGLIEVTDRYIANQRSR